MAQPPIVQLEFNECVNEYEHNEHNECVPQGLLLPILNFLPLSRWHFMMNSSLMTAYESTDMQHNPFDQVMISTKGQVLKLIFQLQNWLH